MIFDWLFGNKKKQRAKLRAKPFPVEWAEMLSRNVPYYNKLTNKERATLHGHAQVFLAEKTFEGCGGLEITDEIRVTIAAQACMLLLAREEPSYYPSLKTIFVYPDQYEHTSTSYQGGMVIEGQSTVLGESWHRGPVVLSWDDVRHGAADIKDGHNVVFHEFAHQLDDERGGTDGAPPLQKRSMYTAWARVLGGEYATLLEKIENHRRSDIDKYGGTNPAEFFAVVTEAFFEKPRQLRKKHPELYEQFAIYYNQDPAARYNGTRNNE